MALSKISFDDLVPGASVRLTPPLIKGLSCLSIRDLIMYVCGQNQDRAGQTWRRISESQKDEVRASCTNFKFPGQGQSVQPVITLEGALKLIMWLPGNGAKDMRIQFSDIIKRYLAGDASMVGEIQANAASDAPIHAMAREAGKRSGDELVAPEPKEMRLVLEAAVNSITAVGDAAGKGIDAVSETAVQKIQTTAYAEVSRVGADADKNLISFMKVQLRKTERQLEHAEGLLEEKMEANDRQRHMLKELNNEIHELRAEVKAKGRIINLKAKEAAVIDPLLRAEVAMILQKVKEGNAYNRMTDMRPEFKASMAELKTAVAELKTSTTEVKTSVAQVKTSVAGLQTWMTYIRSCMDALVTAVMP